MVLIGNDGGLLERPVTLTWFDAAPAERFDVLLDLTGADPGEVITLRSSAFLVPGDYDTVPGITVQGSPMELMQLRVGERRGEGGLESLRLPAKLSTIRGPDPTKAVRERKVHFSTGTDVMSRGAHIQHQINNRSYDMNRIDYAVPFGDTEIWLLSADMMFSHPVHIHATHFKVLERTSGQVDGRRGVMPWEAGLKDTVLVQPGETVKIAVQFTAHRGLFLIRCHNLEHVGMMANVLVE